jgi:large subunit ribosomal protein L24
VQRIKKGDQVIVLAGKDKGRRGVVLGVLEGGERLVVEGVNKVKKHQKPNPYRGQTGGIVEKEMSIHASNIALYNPALQKADRVGIKVLEDGRMVRVFKSNGEMVEA